jgi:mono/diheme cytochrome c family protein
MRKARTTLLAFATIVAGAYLSPHPAVSSEDDPVADEVKASGDQERGERLYNRYCRGCHGEEGKGDGLTFQPHVNNLTKKGYIDRLPDSYLMLAIIKGGRGIGKSNVMPSWEGTLTRQQMLDIIAYVRSLPLNN